jgi:endonuclease/exonuclease/phosphatase family metal-dependent hydrolase
MGVSIASRWPISLVEEVDLRVTNGHTTYPLSALLAEVDLPRPVGKVLMVAFPPDHEPDHERERELQVLRVARRVEDLIAGSQTHTILLGDLNAAPDSATMRFLTGRQSLGGLSVCYRDAWERVHGKSPGPTYSSRNGLQAAATLDWPFEQIDHILVRCGGQGQPTLDVTACEIALDQPVSGIWASDHFALVADFVVP